MTLLLLAAWLPARLVTCLQNARAPKRDKTGEKKKGQGSLVGTERNGTERHGSSVCVQATGERMWHSVCVY